MGEAGAGTRGPEGGGGGGGGCRGGECRDAGAGTRGPERGGGRGGGCRAGWPGADRCPPIRQSKAPCPSRELLTRAERLTRATSGLPEPSDLPSRAHRPGTRTPIPPTCPSRAVYPNRAAHPSRATSSSASPRECGCQGTPSAFLGTHALTAGRPLPGLPEVHRPSRPNGLENPRPLPGGRARRRRPSDDPGTATPLPANPSGPSTPRTPPGPPRGAAPEAHRPVPRAGRSQCPPTAPQRQRTGSAPARVIAR